ncbi:MFS transporter [Hungatella hathewayi]|uniref:MFS transporter n=1 Tax=Hungatella hathewayi TaxID=154046 RepID=UPI00210871B3|nr:MFS transporter [Hungatella hathewayi]MCQ5386822.1 MFS transporter [Hungatella hathewayi]
MTEKTKNVTVDHVEKISTFEKTAYGCGDLASNLILILVTSYVTFFYTDALGLNAAIIGSIMMFSRFADGFSDMLMGYIMDRVRTKYGKARPWLLWLAIPISVATVLIFLVPNTGIVGKYIYVTITYNLVTTVLYTMINIPYGTLTSLMTRDQNQRTVINVFRMLMAQIGSLIINACTLPLVNAMGGSSNQKSWVIVSIIYGLLAAALFLLCFGKTKERVTVSMERKEKLKFTTAFKLIMKNNYWLMLVAAWVSSALSLAFSGAVGAYYAKYILNNENLVGILNAATILPSLVCISLVAPLSKKYGKTSVAIWGSVINLAGQVLMILYPENTTWLIICSLLKGVGNGFRSGTIFAMVADTIEYGEWKTGIRVEGMLYSSTTFGSKIGFGIASAIALGIVGAAGYDGLAAVQTESAVAAIKAIYLYVPIPFLILIPIIYIFYKLDKIYPQVMADLQEREAALKKANNN